MKTNKAYPASGFVKLKRNRTSQCLMDHLIKRCFRTNVFHFERDVFNSLFTLHEYDD